MQFDAFVDSPWSGSPVLRSVDIRIARSFVRPACRSLATLARTARHRAKLVDDVDRVNAIPLLLDIVSP